MHWDRKKIYKWIEASSTFFPGLALFRFQEFGLSRPAFVEYILASVRGMNAPPSVFGHFLPLKLGFRSRKRQTLSKFPSSLSSQLRKILCAENVKMEKCEQAVNWKHRHCQAPDVNLRITFARNCQFDYTHVYGERDWMYSLVKYCTVCKKTKYEWIFQTESEGLKLNEEEREHALILQDDSNFKTKKNLAREGRARCSRKSYLLWQRNEKTGVVTGASLKMGRDCRFNVNVATRKQIEECRRRLLYRPNP